MSNHEGYILLYLPQVRLPHGYTPHDLRVPAPVYMAINELQFRQNSQDIAGYIGNGSGGYRSCLEFGRNCWTNLIKVISY